MKESLSKKKSRKPRNKQQKQVDVQGKKGKRMHSIIMVLPFLKLIFLGTQFQTTIDFNSIEFNCYCYQFAA